MATTPLATAVRDAVRAFRAYAAARRARSDAWLDKHGEYRAAGEAERDTFRALTDAMVALKESAHGDATREAAEAGSPGAKFLEPAREDARLPGEDGGLF